jgi:predicted nicotinamide N-methyase
VWASDVDPLAAAAMRLNAEMNGVVLDVTTDDLVGRDVDAEVVLAGDVTYEPELSRRVIAWLERLARKERTVRVADPGRGFADFVGWTEVARYDAPSDVDVDGRHSVTTRVMGWGLD